MKLNKPDKILSKVLFDISRKDQMQNKMLSDLSFVIKAIEKESQIKSFIQSKRISNDKKLDILNQVFKDKINTVLIEILSLLSGPDSIKVLYSINRYFIDSYRNENNIVDVKIIVANRLSQSQVKTLKTSISKSLGKNIDLLIEVDEGIIGGVKLRVEDTFIDGSIINQLQSLQKELLQI
jgi:F-type H+-transporting ATPase subunit delta